MDCKKILQKIDGAYWGFYRWVRDLISPLWYSVFGYKHHIIKTRLTPTAWYDVDDRLLYGNMELVKWFVENDMRVISEEEYEEEIERIIEEESEGSRSDHLVSWANQYEEQKEILGIYTWWLSYESRMDKINKAMLESFEYDKRFASDPEDIFSRLNADKNMNEEEFAESRRLRQIHWDKREMLEEEEKKMLHKLVELKDGMWS